MKTKQTFFIPGPLPTMNEIILASSSILKGNRRVGSRYTKLKKEWDERVGIAIHLARMKPIGAFTAEFLWIEKNKRKDPDNIAVAVKFVFDALQKSLIIKGDGWAYNRGWSNSFTVGDPPGVKVSLYEVAPTQILCA